LEFYSPSNEMPQDLSVFYIIGSLLLASPNENKSQKVTWHR